MTDYENHVGTSKHSKRTVMIVNGSEKSPKIAKLILVIINVRKYLRVFFVVIK